MIPAILIGYAVGSLPIGYLIAQKRAGGVDLRRRELLTGSFLRPGQGEGAELIAIVVIIALVGYEVSKAEKLPPPPSRRRRRGKS